MSEVGSHLILKSSDGFVGRGAALATGAKCVVKAAPAHFDQRNNLPLSLAYQAVMRDLYGQDVPITSSSDGGADGGSFSTDFGVRQAFPRPLGFR